MGPGPWRPFLECPEEAQKLGCSMALTTFAGVVNVVQRDSRDEGWGVVGFVMPARNCRNERQVRKVMAVELGAPLPSPGSAQADFHRALIHT